MPRYWLACVALDGKECKMLFPRSFSTQRIGLLTVASWWGDYTSHPKFNFNVLFFSSSRLFAECAELHLAKRADVTASNRMNGGTQRQCNCMIGGLNYQN